MTLQEFYARVGGDYSATLSRLPSEALIKKFVLKYPGDPSFEQLRAALDAQDWELAFQCPATPSRACPEPRHGPPVQGRRRPLRCGARAQAAGGCKPLAARPCRP